MTEYSFPWGGDSLGDHGPYSDEYWQNIYTRIVGTNNLTFRGGVFHEVSGDVYVATQRAAGANMSIDVGPGTAMVDGTIAYSDDVENLLIAASHATLDRIDMLVLQLDAVNQTVRLAILTGTPNAAPTPPSVQTDRSPYYEIGMYLIYVSASATSIATSNLERIAMICNTSFRIDVGVYNNSGAWMGIGAPAVWDTSGVNYVTTTTTVDDPNIAGVITSPIAPGAIGRMCILGIAPVMVDDAYAVGSKLITSTAAGVATKDGANVFGRMLEASSGAGLANTIIAIPSGSTYKVIGDLIAHTAATQNTTGTSFVDVDAVNWKTSITPNGTRAAVFVTFEAATSNYTAYFTLAKDGTPVGDASKGLAALDNPGTGGMTRNVSIMWIFEGLTPGVSYDFTLQYRSSIGSSTASVYNNGSMLCWEV